MTNQVTVEEVYKTLVEVESIDNRVRKPAENKLQNWESSSTNGFLSSLVQIINKRGEVTDQLRLLACIVAKNAVGSSWRKTISTREWSHVSLEEKILLRTLLPEILLKEPSDPIAIQISLLISNIARFDFPKDWPDIVEILALKATAGTKEEKYRSIVALKYIFQALQTKVTITSGKFKNNLNEKRKIIY